MVDITYLGHSSFLFEHNGVKIMVDPFISANEKVDVDVNSLDVDIILVTHGHQDHLLDVKTLYDQNDCKVYANYEVSAYLNDNGVECMGFNHGGTVDLGVGTVKYVQAVHSSSLPDGSYGGNPGGFIFDFDKKFYYSGDTALFSDMKLFKPVDFAILCMGGHFTMDYKDALIASEFLKVDEVIGMHYDTFEPINIDHDKVIRYFEKAEKKLTLMDINSKMNK